MKSLVYILLCFLFPIISLGYTIPNNDTVLVVLQKDKSLSRDDDMPPYLEISRDNGTTWQSHQLPLGFNLVNCTGKGDTAVCVATGFDRYHWQPKSSIVASTDGGKTWEDKFVQNYPTTFNKPYISSSSCTGNGNTAMCGLVGSYYTGTVHPIIIISADGGKTWEYKTIPGDDSNITLDKIRCTGNSLNTKTCVAIGTNNSKPYIITSTDDGKSWSPKQIPSDIERYSNPHLVSLSCTGTGIGAVCAITGSIGELRDRLGQFVVTSNDRGNTWKLHDLINGRAYSSGQVSCVGNGMNARCFIPTWPDDYSNNVNIFMSHDAGITWQSNNFNYRQWSIEDYSTHIGCTGFGVVSTCAFFVGYNNMLITRNGGNDWSKVRIDDLDQWDNLNQIECTGDGTSKSVCVAAVRYKNFILISKDGAKSWQKKSLPYPDRSNYEVADVTATGGD